MKKIIAILILIILPVLGTAATLNINTADWKTLARELSGIGEAKAKAIVAYRKKNGKFKSFDDLKKVKGIGKRILLKNKNKLDLSGKTSSILSKKQTETKKNEKSVKVTKIIKTTKTAKTAVKK